MKNNIGTGLPPSNLYILLGVYLYAHMCVYARREGEEDPHPPAPGGFSLALLQNVGGLLYFCLGGKEAKGLYWESCEACPSREPQMLRKPSRGAACA